jgi:hypothetical protein
MIRRRRSKIDGVYDVSTRDGATIRVKPFATTDKRIQNSQRKVVREAMKKTIADQAKTCTLAEFVKNILDGKTGSDIYKNCKKLYPVKRIEIFKTEVISQPTIMIKEKKPAKKEEKEEPTEPEKEEKKTTKKKEKTEEVKEPETKEGEKPEEPKEEVKKEKKEKPKAKKATVKSAKKTEKKETKKAPKKAEKKTTKAKDTAKKKTTAKKTTAKKTKKTTK